MYTVIASPLHVLPVTTQAPTLKDDISGGALEFRRRWTRSMHRWELTLPGKQDKLDPISGLIDYAHGDFPFFFDGGGTLEVTSPILIGIGDGVTYDFRLPHRYVFVASTVIYVNGGVYQGWTSLGDGITMNTLRFFTPPILNAQIKAKYRRKAKVVIDTEADMSRERAYRNADDSSGSVYQQKVFLQEVP